ncbi:hypothetical protein D9611_014057 [Ephemerocybe angulata]|uniref:Uncharacterized protein n=1 Tax=Ephemerocybe angulata TaxID=980116 RepID=A0A8H5ERI5_9AGAR|nr:hypothetical protein D9611_014057 [Tulosesus angulatus]
MSGWEGWCAEHLARTTRLADSLIVVFGGLDDVAWPFVVVVVIGALIPRVAFLNGGLAYVVGQFTVYKEVDLWCERVLMTGWLEMGVLSKLRALRLRRIQACDRLRRRPGSHPVLKRIQAGVAHLGRPIGPPPRGRLNRISAPLRLSLRIGDWRLAVSSRTPVDPSATVHVVAVALAMSLVRSVVRLRRVKSASGPSRSHQTARVDLTSGSVPSGPDG